MSEHCEPLPIRAVGDGRRRRYVATLELDADECEAIAYALGLNDLGAQELLATADRIREMAEEEQA